MYQKLNGILSRFLFDGDFKSLTAIDEGHINTTYFADFTKGKYIIQKINTSVFKNPDELMHNITSVTEHLSSTLQKQGEDPSRQTLHFLRTADGMPYYRDSAGACWRSYIYLDNCYTVDSLCSKKEIYEAARAFGKFQYLLRDFPSENLFETIKDFHNTPKRLDALRLAVSEDKAGRANGIKDEIQFFFDRKADTEIVVNLLKSGELPPRVTHNDTKINNVLFDSETKKATCVIDLDTIMLGSSLYDFGDGIRTSAATAHEDEKDTSKMGIDLETYGAYVSGYLDGTKGELSDKEKELLPFSVKLLTLECAMRFLTDYLNGDTYFRIKYPEHNLVRARAQIKLVKDIEEKFEEMKKITSRAIGGDLT